MFIQSTRLAVMLCCFQRCPLVHNDVSESGSPREVGPLQGIRTRNLRLSFNRRETPRRPGLAARQLPDSRCSSVVLADF